MPNGKRLHFASESYKANIICGSLLMNHLKNVTLSVGKTTAAVNGIISVEEPKRYEVQF